MNQKCRKAYVTPTEPYLECVVWSLVYRDGLNLQMYLNYHPYLRDIKININDYTQTVTKKTN